MRKLILLAVVSSTLLFSCSKNTQDEQLPDVVEVEQLVEIVEQNSELALNYEIWVKQGGKLVELLATMNPTPSDEQIYVRTVDISKYYNSGLLFYLYLKINTQDGKSKEFLLGSYKK